MRWLVLSVAVLLGLWTVSTSLTQVRPGQRAVVLRFGRILAQAPGAGLYVGLPWGIDRVERIAVSKQRRVLIGDEEDMFPGESPSGQFLTGDHNVINAQVEMFYTIVEDEVADYYVQQDRVD